MILNKVAIIGAGLSGLSLALFLKRLGIDVTIYESRTVNKEAPGGVTLSPNALRILDYLGILSRLSSTGYWYRDQHIVKLDFETIDVYNMGDKERFGYDAFRVYRHTMLDEFRAMTDEEGIPIRVGKKFSRIVEETDEGVRFAFADGEELTADLLIGADGIHSKVRTYVAPEATTIFSGIMALAGTVQLADVKIPSAVKRPLEPLAMIGPAGAFTMAPQGSDVSESLVIIQHYTEEKTREEWDALLADREQVRSLMKRDYDSWNEMGKSALDALPLDTMFVWPFYTLKKLSSWTSDKSRVVILGDAAHAIPPAAGQGVCQAFEDVYSLSLLVEAARAGKVTWQEALEWWLQYRQTRFDGVVELTDLASRRRMPGFDFETEGPMNASWVFDVDIQKDVASWLDTKCAR